MVRDVTTIEWAVTWYSAKQLLRGIFKLEPNHVYDVANLYWVATGGGIDSENRLITLDTSVDNTSADNTSARM